MEKFSPPRIQKGKAQVQVEGLVLLKIIKHCQDGLPQVVTGLLVGQYVSPDPDQPDSVSRVEFTNCFPKLTDHSLADKDKNRKQAHDETRHVNFLRCLQKVNMDTENVGWYRSAFYGKFISKSLVKEQYYFQLQVPSAVLLVYDPYSTCTGRLALRAYRLTDKFMEMHGREKMTAPEFQKYGIDLRNVFEELEIQVHNSHMVHAFLYEIREDRDLTVNYDRLYMDQSSRIGNDLEKLGESIDNYLFEGVEWQRWQREAYQQKKRRDREIQERQMENQMRRLKGQQELPIEDIKRKYPPIEDPDRLGAALVTTQMNQYCASITDNITQALNKLCVAQGMHGDVK